MSNNTQSNTELADVLSNTRDVLLKYQAVVREVLSLDQGIRLTSSQAYQIDEINGIIAYLYRMKPRFIFQHKSVKNNEED